MSLAHLLRPQRLLALAILAGLVGSAALAGAQLVRGTVSVDRDDIARSLKLLARYRQNANDGQHLQQRLAALKNRAGTLPGLIEGGTPAIAAANLQARVKGMIEAKGGQVRSAQSLPGPIEAGFERVTVRFDLALPLDSLGDLLYQIESSTPALFIDKLDIHAPENEPPVGTPSRPLQLTIRWDVSGFRKAGT